LRLLRLAAHSLGGLNPAEDPLIEAEKLSIQPEPPQAGVDCAVIALWLGHESLETTQAYLHAHLALKEAALARLKPRDHGKPTRFRPNNRLLAFLEAL
jgi:hypothetical protein